MERDARLDGDRRHQRQAPRRRSDGFLTRRAIRDFSTDRWSRMRRGASRRVRAVTWLPTTVDARQTDDVLRLAQARLFGQCR